MAYAPAVHFLKAVGVGITAERVHDAAKALVVKPYPVLAQ
jgi:hypothetical protein